ncbi:response regulator [Chlorogloeopsis sp. ULAP02]|uniref:ATP-binding response regulator n=1 Tax=Chlorogloeopsis sp. ULAP02 TaxID=3107926 RepID=UPI003136AF07
MSIKQTHLSKGNILIVDDKLETLNLLVSLLSENGYGVLPALSGKMVFKSIQSNIPDLILLDIMMPEMDGYEVCQKLKAAEQTKEIPIIFISDFNEDFDKAKAFSVGGVDYITKPFEPSELLARIENQLRLSRLSKQMREQNKQLLKEIEERKRVEEILHQHQELLQTVVLEERTRMAREIHDTLAQTFTGILVHSGAASRLMMHNSQTAQVHIIQVRDLARCGLVETRRSVEALRPQLLAQSDLCSALKHITKQMVSDLDHPAVCKVTGMAYPLPSDVESNLLRIAQEALTNAIKHANADKIQIDVMYKKALFVLRIKDNGQGFEINDISFEQGFGILGMKERAKQIGAQLTIQSLPGKGTQVMVSVKRN